MIKNTIMIIVAFIIGIAIGGLVIWGIDRVKLAEAERLKTEAILEKNTMQKQWEKAVNELNSTRVVLNDTLAALELLRQYRQIDNDTKEDIAKLKATLDENGKVTEETEETFRSLVDQFNKLNGNLGDISMPGTEKYDIKPFQELKNEAIELYKKAEQVALEFGLNIKEAK